MLENQEAVGSLPAVDTTTWTATFISGKVQELQHHLRKIVDACSTSLNAAQRNEPQPQDLHKVIVYDFSSFANTVQTLKDSASEVIEAPITWSEIAELRHGRFFYLGRNAATHDGNPIISAWSDGYFFVPTDIVRKDKKGLVRIPVPQVDVRTFCLEFASDFSNYLSGKLTPALGAEDRAATPDNLDFMFKLFSALPMVPAFAKEMVSNNQEEIRRAIAAAPYVDPVATAISELEKLQDYCFRQLVAVPPMYATTALDVGG